MKIPQIAKQKQMKPIKMHRNVAKARVFARWAEEKSVGAPEKSVGVPEKSVCRSVCLVVISPGRRKDVFWN